MTRRLRHLGPEAFAPDGLCCPAHHRLVDLIRQSGELRVLSRTPVIDTVLDSLAFKWSKKPEDLIESWKRGHQKLEANK